MLPIAIVRFAPHEGPGYLAQVLEEQRRPWRLVAVDQGEEVPADPAAFAGLVLMGGPMSVNDPLPWIPQVLALVRRAVETNVPVLGHCLGAQLLARALGARVTPNTATEIGWHPVQVRPGGEGWFGPVRSFVAFHWHGETFAIPEGAQWIAQSVACPHQAFAVGPHLGLQFHVEMTAPMVEEWAALGAEEIFAHFGPWVQEPQAMMAATPQWIGALQAIARTVYGRWLAGVDGRPLLSR
ncbi:MAG: synthase [Desulfomicrobiaceae bacterium]|jgi:GMP synthase-like glutamine amidotransferase|nr:synthase [Desulfomicrobiaceae bacterium]MDI3493472.1 hypothetical protein [Desulfomicrobiaceae bacterium]